MLTKDANAVAGAPLYAGAISNIGILFWCATASICFFCFAMVRNRGHTTSAGQFLLAAGILTTLIMFDDLFEVHERILRDVLSIPEYITFSFYGALLAVIIARYRGVIVKSDFVLLVLAIMFFALSMTADLAQHHIPWLYTRIGSFLFEDGCKLLGILSWCGYFVTVGSQLTRQVRRTAPAATS